MRLFRRNRSTPSGVAAAERAAALAHDIAALAPERAAALLAALKAGLDPGADEFDRYRAAETLAGAVYPKYKFSEYARLFLEDRAFLEFYERYMDPGNWHSLDRKYTLNEMLKLVAHLDGDVVECGCYKGASAYMMCWALQGTAALVHLFDSFEGLPPPEARDGDYWSQGAMAATEDKLHETLTGFNNYRVYKGWIPLRFHEIGERRMRFLHVDVDLYRPTLDSLMSFYPRLQPGGIILLDDYGFATCPGAKEAADEFFAAKPERIAMLPTGQAFIIKR
jgi:O-methyltransferase